MEKGKEEKLECFGRPCGGRAVVDSQAVLDMQRMEVEGKVVQNF